MKRLNKKVRIIIICALALVFCYCASRVIMSLSEYKRAEKLYADLRNDVLHTIEVPLPADILGETSTAGVIYANETYETAGPEIYSIDETPPPLEIPRALRDPGLTLAVDFGMLKELNPEAIAWIWIPDTNISYPLMQCADNDKYLHTAYDSSYSSGGSIFLDYRNNPGMTDSHSIIFGHNMRDGSMFGELYKFGEESYVEEHRYVYILLPDRALKYEIFSQYITDARYDSYKLSFTDDEDFSNYQALLKSYSYFSTNFSIHAEMSGNEPVITLSTCVSDYSKRRVVHAILISEIFDDLA